MCDNCRHPKEHIDVSTEFAKALEIVQIADGKVAINHIVNIIRGTPAPEVRAYRHDVIDLFGFGEEKDEIFWKSVLRLALVENFIEKNIELYGLLKLTRKGEDFLAAPRKVLMPVDTVFQKVNDHDFEHVLLEAVHDEELFMLLKELQRQVGKEKGLPPYVIFQESTLEEMATKYPITETELENIPGVGKNKARKFGSRFVELIADYVKKHNVDRPEDLVVKSVVNKSSKTVAIIQNIDKKTQLDDIAKSLNMSLSELLDEMENIVYTGTRFDLSHYVYELIDDDVEEEIFDYYKGTEESNLDAAVDEFDGDFSHDEMQLFRIHFISELAN
jgi:ATP-dependent DNA helicase RecQ